MRPQFGLGADQATVAEDTGNARASICGHYWTVLQVWLKFEVSRVPQRIQIEHIKKNSTDWNSASFETKKFRIDKLKLKYATILEIRNDLEAKFEKLEEVIAFAK